MTRRAELPLADVLDMLLDQHGSPTGQSVAEFAARFPEHRAALIEFAAGWAEEQHLPPPAPLSEEKVAETRHHALAALKAGLDARDAIAAGKRWTLEQLAALNGRTLAQVAAAAALPLPVIAKLNAGRIVPESIGARLVQRIGRFLQIRSEQLIATWSTPAVAGMSFLPPPSRETLADALKREGVDPDQVAELIA